MTPALQRKQRPMQTTLSPETRRLLLAASACLCLAAAAPAFAQTVELKVSHYVPPNHTIHQEFTRWAKDLATKSNGRLKITVFPSGQMGPVTRQFDLARTGVADVAWVLNGALPGRFPMTELAQLPYTFNPDGATASKALSASEASAIMTGLAGQLAKEYEGTRVLYMVVQPNIGLFFNKAAVRKPADMKGMRIRHNGPLPAKMIEAWGATPAAVAPVELADSLEKGTIDGATLNFEVSQSFQLAGAIKTVTDIDAYAVTFAVVMNAAKYDSLPADLRKLIDDSTGVDAARRVGATFDAAEAAGRKYMVDHKVEVISPTAEEQQVFKKPVKPLVGETIKAAEDKGLPARKFYDELRTRVNQVKQ